MENSIEAPPNISSSGELTPESEVGRFEEPKREAPPNISSSGELPPESKVVVLERFEEPKKEAPPKTISAYYSALRLLQLIETTQIHNKYKLLEVDTEQILCLKDKMHSLMGLLDELSLKDVTSDIQALTTTQAFIDCAFKWRNTIDRHVVDQKIGVYGNESRKAISALNEGIVIVIQEIDQIIQQLTSICGECSSLASVREDVVPRSYTTGETALVGIEHPLQKIKKALFNAVVKHRQVIPIVGMGGSGKTTLARRVYEDSATREHFQKRYWVTVSQEHDVRKILQDMLDCKSTKEVRALGEKLHKQIFDKRYLIVLDDLWSREAWEELDIHFPKNDLRSRIIVTTRHSTLGESLSPAYSHKMDLLDEEASWDLLCKQVFDGKDCPCELQDIGRDIAVNCKGLPLSIVTIGGLLSKSEKTWKYWSYVARSVTSLVGIEDDERCMKILSLSYNNMPIHLKLCFLSLTSFGEDAWITANSLIRLWIVNAYVKPMEDRGIEEVALDYLKDLAGRNMIFGRKYNAIMEIEELGVHDLLFDLCRKKAAIENIDVVKDFDIAFARCVGCSTTHLMGYDGTVPMKCCGRIFYQLRPIVSVIPRNSVSFCLKCNKFEIRDHFCSRLWHLDFPPSSISICEERVPHFHGVADDIVPFDSLKHSKYSFPGNALWNVQQDGSNAQQSYEMMPQLRFSKHVPTSNEGFVFEQLIAIDVSFGIPPSFRYGIFCSHSLKRLCIYNAEIDEKEIRALKDLPSLQQLVFKECHFSGCEWRGTPPGFRSLKYLGISTTYLSPSLKYLGISTEYVLENLIVRQVDFPRLETLWLHGVVKTLSICDDLSGISSFQSMLLDGCGPSVVESAKETLKKKRSSGDENFSVKIDGRLESSNSGDGTQMFPCLVQKREEGEFSLFEMMMSKFPSDVVEYQRRLPEAQQQEHLLFNYGMPKFGNPPERRIVKWDAAAALMFSNLKVLSIGRNEWDGYALPLLLKKLNLTSTCIDGERTKCIMELHNLEELTFIMCTFENDEWCSLSKGQFNKLKFLQFDFCRSPKHLKLGEDQFPELLTLGICVRHETLEISHDDICNISSLKSIRLQSCGDSIVQSVLEIMKQKEEDGDESFYVEYNNERISKYEDYLRIKSKAD